MLQQKLPVQLKLFWASNPTAALIGKFLVTREREREEQLEILIHVYYYSTVKFFVKSAGCQFQLVFGALLIDLCSIEFASRQFPLNNI